MRNLMQLVSKRLLLATVVCLCFTCNYAQDKNEHSGNTLPISTPEAEGVSSAGIINFLDAVDKGKNELHSFVILRHGKIISQGWWSPYGKELKHVMFSVSKSFTSVGVGFAVAEIQFRIPSVLI
jgi:hypothetical protein